MYMYAPFDLPGNIVNKMDKEKKRLKRKRKQMNEDAEFFTDDGSQDDFFGNNDLENSDSSFSYENQDQASDFPEETQGNYENTNDVDFLDDQDIAILKTLLEYKFSSPIVISPQPIIDSALELINENITNSISSISDSVAKIKQLITQTEEKIETNQKLTKQILEKAHNFKESMKSQHQNFKYLFDIPLFHRIVYKIQDIFFYIWPYFCKTFKHLISDRFS